MDDLQTLFTEAVGLHHRNNFFEAESLYLQIHRLLPENVNVLANLCIVYRDLGRFDEAEEYCRKALCAVPNDPTHYLNLGAIFEARNDLDGAMDAYEKALGISPNNQKILNNYGKLLHLLGFSARGVELLEKALRIEPDYPLALNNLGVIHSEIGAFDIARKCLEKSVELDSYNVNTLYNLAGIFNAQNEYPKAQSILNRLLAIDPDHQAASHMLAALSGDTPKSAPRLYVEEIFDKYAHRFDVHIEKALGYTAPSVLFAMVKGTLSAELPFASALDLGCGTGLSGATFRGITTRLVGVDVSALMLTKAREKNLYDRLEQEEILTFLQSNEENYDLFIASDVLIYLGDPKPLFSAIAARTKGVGVVACSIEQTQQADEYALLPSGRYAHNPLFLQACAEEAGFNVCDHQPHKIRKERGEWLAGDLYVFIKASLP